MPQRCMLYLFSSLRIPSYARIFHIACRFAFVLKTHLTFPPKVFPKMEHPMLRFVRCSQSPTLCMLRISYVSPFLLNGLPTSKGAWLPMVCLIFPRCAHCLWQERLPADYPASQTVFWVPTGSAWNLLSKALKPTEPKNIRKAGIDENRMLQPGGQGKDVFCRLFTKASSSWSYFLLQQGVERTKCQTRDFSH